MKTAFFTSVHLAAVIPRLRGPLLSAEKNHFRFNVFWPYFFDMGTTERYHSVLWPCSRVFIPSGFDFLLLVYRFDPLSRSLITRVSFAFLLGVSFLLLFGISFYIKRTSTGWVDGHLAN